jgi:hypothetical protein
MAVRSAFLAKIRAQDDVDRVITRLSNGAIYCLTVWAITNSIVLTAHYSYRASRLLGHTGWSSVFAFAVCASLASPLVGFALASVAIINDPANWRARGAFALAVAVISQSAYMFLTMRVY